jgi:hypothetical protein
LYKLLIIGIIFLRALKIISILNRYYENIRRKEGSTETESRTQYNIRLNRIISLILEGDKSDPEASG